MRWPVEEAKPEVAHEPLVGCGGGEIDAGRLHVEGDGADPLDDVGVHVRPVRVSEVAHRLEVVLEAVVHRDEVELDELRLAIDHTRQVLELNSAVARHDDAEVEPLLLQFLEVNQRPLEVQPVGDDVAVEAADA